ncbi:MAG: hypothetical protein DMG40_25990 [Acidobacteria bacterium]|nr:MAG: hypothetical protein DMG40_25990 [Acidobacteriota bacterium]
MTPKQPKYQVKIDGEWVFCRYAERNPSGWLHYELEDGTQGLKRLGTWRTWHWTNGVWELKEEK